MKKFLTIPVFMFSISFCQAQSLENSNLRNAPKIYTVKQHVAWIVDSYTCLLKLSPSQKEAIYQTIQQAYNNVPKSEFYTKIKDDFDLELVQSMQVHFELRAKMKDILTQEQYLTYSKIEPYPENCFSLRKDYKLYASSNSNSYWNIDPRSW